MESVEITLDEYGRRKDICLVLSVTCIYHAEVRQTWDSPHEPAYGEAIHVEVVQFSNSKRTISRVGQVIHHDLDDWQVPPEFEAHRFEKFLSRLGQVLKDDAALALVLADAIERDYEEARLAAAGY